MFESMNLAIRDEVTTIFIFKLQIGKEDEERRRYGIRPLCSPGSFGIGEDAGVSGRRCQRPSECGGTNTEEQAERKPEPIKLESDGEEINLACAVAVKIQTVLCGRMR